MQTWSVIHRSVFDRFQPKLSQVIIGNPKHINYVIQLRTTQSILRIL